MLVMRNTGRWNPRYCFLAPLPRAYTCFRSYQNYLQLSRSHLDTLLEDTSSTLSLLGSLSDSFKAVQAQTTTFRKQCEGLLQEQERMTDLATELEKNLKYYAFLEPATRRLNAPGAGSFVRSKEFSDLLGRLDECLDYMTAHVRLLLFLQCGLSNFIDISSRSPYLPLPVSLAADKGVDVNPGSLCWRLARDCVGCDTTHC
jgi:hypothetical protein